MRVPLVVVSMLAVGGGAAVARPLPDGMKVSLEGDALYVAQGGLTVSLMSDASRQADQVSDLTGAELSDDGKQIVVHANSCRMPEDGIQVPLAEVQARFENLRGMQLHLKKKYGDAIVHFAAAVKLDPDTPLYVTNLLSAQSLARRFEDADRALAAYAAKQRAWFAWRLAVDPELAALRTRPAARALVPAKPSKLAFAALGDDIAVSPTGLVAVTEWNAFGGPGVDHDHELVLYDPGAPDTPPVRLDATHKAAVDPVLARLGFEKRATTWVDAMDHDHITSPDKSIEVVQSDDAVTITRGKQRVSFEPYGGILKVGFAGNLVIVQQRENGYIACDGDAQRSFSRVVVLE